VLELVPDYIPAINNIGAAYMNLEQNDSAFKYYKLAVKLDSTYENASLNLGLLYHSLRQYDSAIVYIQEAIRLDPTKGKNYFRLACSYALNNQPAQAISYLKQAFEKGYKNYDSLLTDPDVDNLKNLKEFKELLDKYLPDKKDRQ
jgi:tetratricopeptide (TPR) repeat protein